MLINLSAKHMTLTPAIEDYARKKVEKLPRYFDRIQSVGVVIEKGRNGFTVEVRTDVERHDDFIATSSNEDLYACIDLTVDRSIRQLTDHKSRIRNHHHAPHHNGVAEKVAEQAAAKAPSASAVDGRAAPSRPAGRAASAAGTKAPRKRGEKRT
jgi:putative sigma-54 modulation protein